MSVREARREATLDTLADHMLAHGLGGSSLKALAAAAGTSDRMLLYYFTDKDDLLAAALGRIAARMTALMDVALPPSTRLPYAQLLEALGAALRSPGLRPYMSLWLELAAVAARGGEPHLAVAGRIADGFLAWGAAHLATPPGVDPKAEAARLLATIDGMLLLDAVGRAEAADLAASKATRTAS